MNEPIAVAHLITKLELGGAQQNTLFTVSHLSRDRFRPMLLTGEPGLLDAEAAALPGVAFYQVPSMVRPINPLMDLLALMALTRLLAKLKPAIVHTHSSKAGILGRVAARLAGVPVIVHSIHGFGFTPAHGPLARRFLVTLERLAARVTTGFIAVSEANRRQGVALGLFSADRCTVVRSGIDLDLFRNVRVSRPAKRRELGLDQNRPVVGMIAPFKPQKAPLDFVRMAALVQEGRPDAQFLLVGDGELRSAVEAEIAKLGLAGSVHVAGWRRDIPDVMHCLDVLVLTSRWEGLPRVYLEALASGVPVVGTRVDGAAEVIHDSVNGYLAEPGDVRGLAERVLSLLNRPEEAARMGQAGRSLPGEFDIHEMVRQQERAYEQWLAATRNEKSLSRAAAYGTPTKN
ncbi:MAG: glycosyltransferase family 4 protein [Nitrospirota bacterium]|nr:glycosyltransferase family 4 protein [Nitrospirota bacterium]